MAGLFGQGLGLGAGLGLGQNLGSNGVDPDTATSLGLIAAMRQSQEAGLQRTASPIGSIAQNLMPLFTALIISKAAQNQAAAQAEGDAQENVKNQAQLAETAARTKYIGAQTDALNKKQNDPMAALSADQRLADMADPNSPNYNPQMARIWKFAQQGKIDVAAQQGAAVAQAKAPGELDLFKQKEDIKAAQKKPLTKGQVDEFSSGLGLMDSFDKAIEGFKTTTGQDILVGTLSGGLMSNDALRSYNKVFNEIDNLRAGARGMTQAALDRVRKDLPPPQMALFDPAGFARQFQTARDSWYNNLANRVHATSKRQDVDESILSQVEALAPKGKVVPGTDTSTVEVDPQLAPGALISIQKLMKAGYTRVEAKTMIMKHLGLGAEQPVGVPDSQDTGAEDNAND